jgi:mercuric ion transport protein
MALMSNESRFPAYLSLFASVSTLLCCALPSLLVLLGLGATVASTLTMVPWLVTLSRHKAWVFAGAAALFAFNFYYVRVLVPRLQGGAGCPPEQREACERVRRQSSVVMSISGVLLAVGFVVAYALPPVLEWVDR